VDAVTRVQLRNLPVRGIDGDPVGLPLCRAGSRLILLVAGSSSHPRGGGKPLGDLAPGRCCLGKSCRVGVRSAARVTPFLSQFIGSSRASAMPWRSLAFLVGLRGEHWDLGRLSA
jgi:hypothetical protein